jgi:Retrotransposon gag protein
MSQPPAGEPAGGTAAPQLQPPFNPQDFLSRMNAEQITEFASQLVQGLLQPTSTEGTHDSKEKLATIPTFDGTRSKLRGFLTQLKIRFRTYPKRYATHEDKITCAISHLTGQALDWITPRVEGKRPMFDTWEEFEENIKVNYGDTDAEETARQRLEDLRQTDTVAAYWTAFQNEMIQLDYNDSVLQTMFLKGVENYIKQRYIDNEIKKKNVTELATWAIELDNRRRRMKHLMKNPVITQTVKTITETTTPRRQDGTFAPKLTTSQGGDAMDLDATKKVRYTKLAEEEKQRRRKNGLCLYCGGKGHFANQCPMRPKGPQLRMTELMNTEQESEKDQAQEEN